MDSAIKERHCQPIEYSDIGRILIFVAQIGYGDPFILDSTQTRLQLVHKFRKVQRANLIIVFKLSLPILTHKDRQTRTDGQTVRDLTWRLDREPDS